MTLEVLTIIFLRARIEALQQEQPVTVSARASLAASIAELEGSIEQVRSGALTPREGMH